MNWRRQSEVCEPCACIWIIGVNGITWIESISHQQQQENRAVITSVESDPAMLGRIASVKTTHKAQHNKMQIFLLTSGPIIWLNMVNGFRDSVILPSGCGKVGEWLGLSRAFPTGFLSAVPTGKTSTWILTLPLISSLPVSAFFALNLSQNLLSSSLSNVKGWNFCGSKTSLW